MSPEAPHNDDPGRNRAETDPRTPQASPQDRPGPPRMAQDVLSGWREGVPIPEACASCGAVAPWLPGEVRWNGTRWEHRSLIPQAGHHEMTSGAGPRVEVVTMRGEHVGWARTDTTPAPVAAPDPAPAPVLAPLEFSVVPLTRQHAVHYRDGVQEDGWSPLKPEEVETILADAVATGWYPLATIYTNPAGGRYEALVLRRGADDNAERIERLIAALTRASDATRGTGSNVSARDIPSATKG